jgi:hypothetical protein
VRGWWATPGPSEFVARVVDDLREGRHAVLILPAHGPLTYGLEDELEERWRPYGTLERLVPEPGLAPLACMARRFGAAAGTRLSVGALADLAGMQQRTFWLCDVGADDWPRWRAFLDEFQHAGLHLPLMRRPLFVVPLEGDRSREPPRADAGLAWHAWDGSVDALDMGCFSAALVRRWDLSPAGRALAAAVVAELALFDPTLAVRLATTDLDTLLAPEALLARHAEERGWSAATPTAPHLGTAGTIEIEHRHSALEALNAGVGPRIWRAQVAVLFPRIEEYRQRLAAMLMATASGGNGTRRPLAELEIGPMARAVRRWPHLLPPRERAGLDACAAARNALAHRKPLRAREVTKLLALVEVTRREHGGASTWRRERPEPAARAANS